MTRPTIKDLALAAGVSVSTINRALAGSASVKNATLQQVREAAERIGCYGIGAIKSHVVSRKPKRRFGLLLHQPNRTFHRMLGADLKASALAVEDHEIEAEIVFAEDLSAESISNRLLELGDRCNAVAVVSAGTPGLRHTIAAELKEPGFDTRTIADMLSQKTGSMAVHDSQNADLHEKLKPAVAKTGSAEKNANRSVSKIRKRRPEIHADN
jgi:hypothetical protein